MIIALADSAVQSMPLLASSTGGTATFNVSGATLVSVSDASTANFTITLSNLRIGLLVYGWIRNSGSSAIAIKVAATTPSGATYDVRGKQSSLAPFDFTATGIVPRPQLRITSRLAGLVFGTMV